MASYIKRLRGYIAPIFVVYTVLVTYFLAQRAWDDVSDLLRRRNEAKFLDVLVQEERRHLRSFQDVVDNYRFVVSAPTPSLNSGKSTRGEKSIYKKEGHNVNRNHIQKDLDLIPEKSTTETELDLRYRDSNKSDNESGTLDVTDFPRDLNLQLQQESQDNREARPFFQVEVEEWDASALHTRQQPKPLNISLEDSTHPRFNVDKSHQQIVDPKLGSVIGYKYNNQNTMQPRKEGGSPGQQGYTLEYCENVSDLFLSQSSICMRELAETGTQLKLNISSYSLLFRELGDIIIFSAFLDTRDTPYVIRLITLGHKEKDNSKSVYWCVFYLRSVLSNSNPKNVSDTTTTTVDRRNYSRQGTQLIYYSASDGHNRNSQFYIMSCTVPEPARSSLLPPFRGLFQIVVGNIHQPFLGKSQESITLKVIINNPDPMATSLGSRPLNSYFDNMEHDLLTLNISNITDNYVYISNSSSHSNNSRSSHTNNNNSRSSHINNSNSRSSHTNSSNSRSSHTNNINGLSSSTNNNTRVLLERLYLRNVSDSKIVTCVAPLQGTISVVQLVEFIELTLLLGSQHLVFYTFQVTEETARALYMYVGRGLVTVLPWNIPNPQSVWANGRDMALNDCLYRTMHVYDYALFLDIDEFLVPRVTPDIPSFLKYLKAVHKFNSTKFSDLVFSSAYFPPPTKTQHKNLTTVEGFTRDISKFVSLKSVHRTYINLKHTLRLIKLSKALRVGAGERKRTSFTISPRFAFVNHYSYCPQEAHAGRKDKDGVDRNSQEKNRPDICSRTKQDFVMWRYKSILVQRVKDSVKRLNGG